MLIRSHADPAVAADVLMLSPGHPARALPNASAETISSGELSLH
jgi:hypothetical protein